MRYVFARYRFRFVDILFVSKTSWRRLQDLSSRRLQEIYIQDMSSRCLQDMSWRRLKDVSSVWRRLGRRKIGTLKTCWKPTNVCWDNITLNVYQQERLVNTRKYQNKRLKLVLNGLRKQINTNTGLNMIVENHAFQIRNCRTSRSFSVFVSNDTRPSRIFDRVGEW